MESFSKRYKIIPFILIFMTPLVSILYNVLKLVPQIKEITAPYASVFSLIFNLLWVIFTVSLIKMMIQVWKNVHDSYQLVLAQKARDMLLIQEKEVEQFQKDIVKRQEEVYRTLERALKDSEVGEYEALEKEITQLTEHIQINRSETFCSNSLLNTILQIKKEKAQKVGIHCNLHIILPSEFSQAFSDVTITSLFTNLLDNAIEACESMDDEKIPDTKMTDITEERIINRSMPDTKTVYKVDFTDENKLKNKVENTVQDKFIELNTNYQANMFLIEMRNSKNPKNAFDHKTTKKENKEAHGHGLSIIEDIVKQYEGICNWEDEGEVFHSSVMLKIKKETPRAH